MFIEQTVKFEFRGFVPLGRVCTPATGYFYYKTKISGKSSSELLFTAKILQ